MNKLKNALPGTDFRPWVIKPQECNLYLFIYWSAIYKYLIYLDQTSKIKHRLPETSQKYPERIKTQRP